MAACNLKKKSYWPNGVGWIISPKFNHGDEGREVDLLGRGLGVLSSLAAEKVASIMGLRAQMVQSARKTVR